MRPMFSKKTWAAFFLLISMLMLLLFFPKLDMQDDPITSRLTIALFFISPAGNIWMIYDCLSHDGRWTRKIWLAFLVPFAFVWYYVERYRPRLMKRKKRAL